MKDGSIGFGSQTLASSHWFHNIGHSAGKA